MEVQKTEGVSSRLNPICLDSLTIRENTKLAMLGLDRTILSGSRLTRSGIIPTSQACVNQRTSTMYRYLVMINILLGWYPVSNRKRVDTEDLGWIGEDDDLR